MMVLMTISSVLAATLCCCLGLGVGPAFATRTYEHVPPTVTVKNGSYTGLYSSEYGQDFFLGMPYAKKAPRLTIAKSLDTAWNGSRKATAYPPHCVGYGGDDIGYEISEDCLYLNVVRPAGIDQTANLPVAVWIHGGGLNMGGSADRRYNLSFIVENSVKQGTPMIGVSLNYRLSVFGFLIGKEAREAGATNIGFRDQRLALHWIKENIAAFGGAPDKVTIWGESSGAESVAAQVLAYNGRDDGLFRAAIGESGFGGFLNRYRGGLNATNLHQETFNNLLRNTSTCATTVGTASAIPCLRDLPLAEIHHAVNVTGVGPWSPVIDGDFVVDYPSSQLKSGRFARVPILIGANSDEGTSFGKAMGPGGRGVHTDDEFAASIRKYLSPNLTTSGSETSKTVEQIIDELMAIYPNIQSIGVPSLSSWPEVVTPSTTGKGIDINTIGLQYRRTASLYGDLKMHYFRRLSNIAWHDAGLKSWSYRFDVTVNGIPDHIAATHFQEVAFVFNNLNGNGYATNPFATKPDSYRRLSATMSSAWINFVTGLDPNGSSDNKNGNGVDNASLWWPAYDTNAAGGVGQNMVWRVDGSYVEFDDYRAPGIKWLADHSLDVLGN